MLTNVAVLLQLYDRISSKVVSPTRAPPSDGVQRCRDALDALVMLEHRRDVDPRDLDELRELLARPHLRVSTLFSYTFISSRAVEQ